MSNTLIALDVILIGVVLASAILDLRTRRIPNWLTVSALGVALLVRLPMGGDALLTGLAAAAVAFLITLPFFALGGLGGGDVKLLTAVGAFLGMDRLWGALFVTAVAGGVFALFTIIRRRRFKETAWNFYMISKKLPKRSSYAGWKQDNGDGLNIRSAGALTQPYGVAIAIGAIWAINPFF